MPDSQETGGCVDSARSRNMVMNFDWFLENHPEVELTNEQIACCRRLERQGKRFLVDFGYESAPALVWAEIDAYVSLRRSDCAAER